MHLTKFSFAVVCPRTFSWATSGLASPATGVPPTSIGYDIRFPQCGEALPSSAGFGIVGANNGHPFSANPCLARELAWAQGAVNANPGFYANVDNPGPAFTSNWPMNQRSPKGCSGADTVACSYDYRWNAPRVTFASAVNAERSSGSSSPAAAAVAAPWWLEVETGNRWQTVEVERSFETGAYDEASIGHDRVVHVDWRGETRRLLNVTTVERHYPRDAPPPSPRCGRLRTGARRSAAGRDRKWTRHRQWGDDGWHVGCTRHDQRRQW